MGNAQATRRGYEYQDLIAISEILSFYEQNKDWEKVTVEIESLDTAYGSLEDIVISNSDGSKKLIQSKYSLSDDKEVGWDDFLKPAKKKGTSLFHKWINSFLDLKKLGVQFDSYLYTTWCLSEDVRKTIDNEKITWDKVPQDKKKILLKIADEADLKLFFNNFKFKTSLVSLEEFYDEISHRLIKLFNDHNIFHRLLHFVKLRATSKNNHTITFNDLIALIESVYPVFNQKFSVPETYNVPDKKFEKQIIEKIKNKEKHIVLIGEPGIGKSTFISNLFETLRNQQDVFPVRHHYYISNGDYYFLQRFLASNVFADLSRQLGIGASSNPKDIYSGLSDLLAQGIQPIVFIDGLDHLVRGDKRYKDELKTVIRVIKEFPEGTTVVFASQPTDKDILSNFKKEEIIDFPYMEKEVIKEFILEKFPNINKRDIGTLVDNLETKTRGNPTILNLFIQLLKERSSDDKTLNIYSINSIMAYTGKIQEFYSQLYEDLSLSAQDALKVMGATEFTIWDKNHIALMVKEVGYELNQAKSGVNEIVKFFKSYKDFLTINHESFLIFIRSLENNKREKTIVIVDKVLSELPEDSYWRLFYLPLLRIKQGVFDIKSIITRDYIANLQSYGFGYELILKILDAAEKETLKNKDYVTLLKLKHYKRRLNRFDYNIHDQELMQTLTLSLLSDRAFHYDMLKNHADFNLLPISIIQSIELNNEAEINKELENLVWEKELKETRFKEENNNSFDKPDWSHIHHMALLLDNEESAKSVSSLEAALFLIEKSFNYKKLNFAKRIWSSVSSKKIKGNLTSIRESTIRLLSIEDVKDISCWESYGCFKGNSPLCYFWVSQNSKLIEKLDKKVFEKEIKGWLEPLYKDNRPMDLYGDKKHDIVSAYVELFFYNVLYKNNISIPKYHTNFPLLYDLISDLISFAIWVKNNRKSVTSHGLIERFCEFLKSNEGNYNKNKNPFKMVEQGMIYDVLQRILLNLYIILFKDFSKLDLKDFEHLGNQFDLETVIFHRNYYNNLKFSSECILKYIEDFAKWEHGSEGMNSLVEHKVNISTMLKWVGKELEAKEMLRQAYKISLHYENRKDAFVYEVMDSVEHCYKHSIGLDLDWHMRVGKIVCNMDKFTDGKGTSNAPLAYADMILNKDYTQVVDFYETAVVEDEKYLADGLYRILAEYFESVGKKEYFENTYEKEKEDNDSTDQENFDNDLKMILKIRPNSFIKLWDFLNQSNRYNQDKLLQAWLGHWAKKEPDTLIKTILKNQNTLLDSFSINKAWDKLADFILKVRGKTEAYPYFVLSHQKNMGWHSYYSQEDSLIRLEKIAKTYPDEWEKFIYDGTSYTNDMGDKNGINFGTSLLVHFLCKVGQYDLAKDITETLVCLIEQDTNDFNLETPAWIK